MTRFPAERASTAYWRREVLRDQERAWSLAGTDQEAAAEADLAESRARLAEAEAVLLSAIRKGRP